MTALLLGGGSVSVYHAWNRTETMTIDEAMRLLGTELTPPQRHLVASALRRQVLAAIRALKLLAEHDKGVAGIESRNALNQAQDELR